ncbi:MAG: DUF1638 domain-containing protein [Verrucomicrobiota bacterium]|nr:DUF1638 domain-containing protein [Verrucomicrobiota bacterium]
MTRPVHVIACNVLETEVHHWATVCGQKGPMTFFEIGLHDAPANLRAVLQAAIDEADMDDTAEAVVLVYGLCGLGTHGLYARTKPLVLPRAHDCMTLFLGHCHRYDKVMREDPGTYWYAPGWQRAGRAPGADYKETLREQYKDRFDEDQIEALLEMQDESMRQHSTAGYVDLAMPGDAAFQEKARAAAEHFGWQFKTFKGDPGLLRDLLSGAWDDERFLVVPPGHCIQATGDEHIIRACPPEAGA